MCSVIIDRATSWRGPAWVILASVLWSTSGLFAKSPPLTEIPLDVRGPVIACIRAIFACVLLAPFVNRKRIRWRWALLPMTVAFATMNLTYVSALTRTTAAAAIFLQNTAAIWTLVLGVLVLGERFEVRNLVAVLLVLLGITGIVISDWQGGQLLGNALALTSGLAYAVVVLCLRHLRDESAPWLIFLNHFVSAGLLLPWLIPVCDVAGPSQWAVAGLMGVVQMGLPYVVFARGVREVTAQNAALLTLIEPILNPLWVWLLWREQVPMTTWIGGGCILAGLVARTLWVPSPVVNRVPAEST